LDGVILRALRVAKEQSMLSADKGEVMVVKMENHKIKEGRVMGGLIGR
jgi:hypothetical protein